MLFVYGLLTATAAIVAAEIVFEYSLGDFLKDLTIHLFQGAEHKLTVQYRRAEARYKYYLAKLRKGLEVL